MTTTEFSNEFDILYNNIDSNQAPGLNEYEKSVFLTKAQEQLVIDLYNGRNQWGVSFESTEETRRYLDTLIKTAELSSDDLVDGMHSLSKDSKFFKLPSDVLFVVAEKITYADDENTCINGFAANVYVTTQDEFAKIRNNPFRGATKYKALRLDSGLDNNENRTVEIVSDYDIDKYTVRYLRMPRPIVISVDNSEAKEYYDLGLSIRGFALVTRSGEDPNYTYDVRSSECELPEVLHPLILQSAVNLAKITWQTTTNKS